MEIELDVKKLMIDLSWFLQKYFIDLDSGDRWINWIMQCITITFIE